MKEKIPTGMNRRTLYAIDATLRDWFAGQALTVLLHDIGSSGWSESLTAKAAYCIADAMLKAREL